MSDQPETMEQEDVNWQRKLLPFMTHAIAVMGLLFFISSFVQLHLMYLELKVDPDATQLVAAQLHVPGGGNDSGAQGEDLSRWNGLLALEHETLARQNQVMNAVLLRQATLLHLGFLTGMVLCLVGSVFVLGRLQVGASSLSGGAQELKFALNTSSPGIILAVLGGALMCVTLFHQFQFNLPARAVYLTPVQYSVEKASDPPLQEHGEKPGEKPSDRLFQQTDESPSTSPFQSSDWKAIDPSFRQSDEEPSSPLFQQSDEEPSDTSAPQSDEKPSDPP